MSTLKELVEFIKVSGDDYNVWGNSKWESELTRSVPIWRDIVKDPSSWEEIEKVRPKGKYYDDLCEEILTATGIKLAKRWFYSEVSDQQNAAKRWLDDHVSKWSEFDQDIKKWIVNDKAYVLLKSLDPVIWKDLNDDMKNEFLTQLFDIEQGEPFKTIKEYIRSLDLDYPGHHIQFDKSFIPLLPCIAGYVPAPKVEKVRSIIKDADDKKYLDRINEMISQREKACQNISIPEIHMQQRISYSPSRNERELIARLMEKTIKSGYLSTALPSIYVSSEPPPIFIAYPELEEEEDYRDEREEYQIPRNSNRRRPETISIEELLGVYQPQHQQIIIYERGIKWRRNRFDEEWLFSVVLIHEISHWITHLLPQPGTPTWSTDIYILGETDVHEGWAQLMTWWVADEVGGKFKRTFEELNQNQSSPYRVFEDFKNEPIEKVMESLEKLRLLSWPVRLQDWKKAIG